MVRSERFNLRLEPEEADMLRKLGDAYGVGGSGAVRFLIREAYERKFGALPKKPKRAQRKSK
ncbi:MAG TPA: hypothetical protein VGI10_28415 [Polyangiaceae bacterium]|jgi:hypothetical protein